MLEMEGFAELSPFVLSNVRQTGEIIGRGAYASVEKVLIPGAACAAKKIHNSYTDVRRIPAEGLRRVTASFVRECQLMTTLRHPHIVQFMGVCFWPDSPLPILVMELLCTDLHSLLDYGGVDRAPPTQPEVEKKPFFPLDLKVSILHDVASGLCYLHEHSPPIIHRDLSARNVLLTSGMVAKISDLGVARVVSFIRGRANDMSIGPGAIVYMPPEAIHGSSERPQQSSYDGTIDIFSFGVVAIFTLSQTFPQNLKEPNYTDTAGVLKARTELERRADCMQVVYDLLSQGDPLITLIKGCLQNMPVLRPDIQQVVQLLDEARAGATDEQSAMNKLQLIQSLHEHQEMEVREYAFEREIQAKNMALLQLEEANQELRIQLDDKHTEARTLQEQVDSLIQQGAENLRTKDEEMDVMKEEKKQLLQQLQEVKSSSYKKLTSLEEKLTSSEELVAEFQSTLLEKERKIKQLESVLDLKKSVPIPKPRKRLPSRPDDGLSRQSPTKASEPHENDTSSPTPHTKADEKEYLDSEPEKKNSPSKGKPRAEEQYPPAYDTKQEEKFTSDSDKKLKVSIKLTESVSYMTRGSAASDEKFAYFTPLGSNAVHRYSLNGDKWSQLPQCPYRNSALAVVEGALITVGGRTGIVQYSNRVLTLRLGTWFEELPPMSVARDSPSLVMLQRNQGGRNIVVVGGSVSESKWSASVEMLDMEMKTWSLLVDLPKPLPFPSAALCCTDTNGTVILSVISCYRQGHTCSLYLSKESVRMSGWASLPQLPASGLTAGVLKDQLLVVGGKKGSNSVSLMHQLVGDNWVELGTVSCGRECLIATTPGDQMVIVGGDGGCGRVCICSVI